jgi:subtilisin family serine protease
VLNKIMILALAAALLAAWTAAEVAVAPWPTLAVADDDDDDDDRDDDDDDRRRPPVPLKRAPATPRGQPEILASALSAADLDRLLTRGFTLVRSQQITVLATTLARLRTPARLGRRQALETARQLAPGASFTSNDLYRRLVHSAYRPSGGSCGERCEAYEMTGWTLSVGRCAADVPIGVVDTGVDLSHSSLAGTQVAVRTIRSPDRPPSGLDHGTAVVSLLVGRADSEVVGIIPGARVLVADAFHGQGQASSADAFDLIAAIDWLVAEGVKVVNLSLSGPDNEHLQGAIARVQQQGVLLIAASGRPDRSRSSGFPARYPGVVAVSAVDSRLRPSRLAIRGDHIAFAAPGAGIAVARRPSGVRRVEGTSFAAPFVSAAYAIGLARGQSIEGLTDLLARSAKDLGPAGRDSLYGWGLLQYLSFPSC